MSFLKDDNGLEENNHYDALDQTPLSFAETQALYHVAQSLIVSPNLSELLQAVVNTIAETLPANRVILITFDLEARQISHFVTGGLGKDDVEEATFDDFWDGLIGWTLRELKPALSPKLIPDIRESMAVQRRRIETNCGAIIVVPLYYQNTILGTITAINRPEERDFTNRDVALMMAMANQSAIAIEHALLVKKMQLANEELEQRVRERTSELTQTNLQLQQEIAERKEAERKLQESETLLRHTLEATQIGIWDWDVKNDLWYASPVYYSMLGYEPKTGLANRSEWRERVHPDDQAYMREKTQDVLSRDFKEYQYEARIRHADGSYRWQHVMGFVTERDHHGKVTRILGIRMDVNKRKLVEESLRESETRYRSIVTAMTEGIVLQDVEGRILTWNTAAALILGLTGDQMAGRTSVDLSWRTIHEDGTPFPSESHPAMVTLRTGEPQRYVIMGIQKSDGNLTWISINCEPLIRPYEMRPYAAVSSFADITERKQAEEERRSHLWFLESMDQINRAIQGANDLGQMMSSVLDAAMTIFACDRAWLVNPCDPDAATWQVHMEHSRPEYPALIPIGVELPLNPTGAAVYRILRGSPVPVQFGPGSTYKVPIEMADDFSVKSFIATAFYPKIGKPWAFGLHQCAYGRIWTSSEERLFQEISRRLSDALTSLIAFRNLQASERKLIDAQRLAHAGHWEWDAVQHNLEWSDETYRIFGLEPRLEPITLQRLGKFIHPDDREAVSKAIGDAEADIKPYDIEYRIVRPDGAIRYIYNLGEVIFDQNQKPLGMFGTLIDMTERRQMEDVLRKSEQKYRSLIQIVQTAIIVHDGEGNILNTNPLAQHLLNLPEDQLLGKALDEPTWHFLRENGSDMPISEYPVSRVLTSQQPLRDYMVGIQHANANEIIWALVNAEPEYGDGGEIIRIIVSFIEITERKRAEETLRRQNEYFAALYETTLAVMNRLNTEDLLSTILSRAVALVGTAYGSIFLFSSDKKELVAAIYTGYPKDLPLRHAEIGKGLLGTVWQTGKIVVINDYQNWPKRSLGVIPDMLRANLGIPLKSNDELFGILCVDYHEEGRTFSEDDIAILTRFAALASIALDNAQLYNSVQKELEERKQVELTLQRYNKRLSILRDIDHQILFASSPQFIATIVLKHLAELIPCEFLSVILHDHELTEERIFALRLTPDLGGVYTQEIQPVVQNEVLEKLKSGETAIAPDLLQQAGPHAHLAEELESNGVRSALASPMMVQNRLIGTIALASLQVGFFTSEHQQITEEVSAQIAIALHQAELNEQIARYNTELEQRVNERTTQLKNANEELELFSYSVSHDLRAPLRAIQGFAEIIARRHKADLNEEGRHYFDNIVTASEQMDRLITDLLDYVRLGQRHVDLEMVSILEVLNEVVENLALEIEKVNGQIHYSGDLPYVLGDKSLLRRIFTNLVENALIYHGVGTYPVIDVRSEVKTDYVVIHVADNGIGIAPEFSEKIFNIFQRLHTNDQYPGTGIGLAIVRKSVEMLNGFVWVESSTQVGSVFCVKLPYKAEKRK